MDVTTFATPHVLSHYNSYWQVDNTPVNYPHGEHTSYEYELKSETVYDNK
jgi:hypothetical protein